MSEKCPKCAGKLAVDVTHDAHIKEYHVRMLCTGVNCDYCEDIDEYLKALRAQLVQPTADEKCPKCGEPRVSRRSTDSGYILDRFRCGTECSHRDGKIAYIQEHQECLRRQLTAKEVENDQLRESLSLWQQGKRTFHYCVDGQIKSWSAFLCSSCRMPTNDEADFDALEKIEQLESVVKSYENKLRKTVDAVPIFIGKDYWYQQRNCQGVIKIDAVHDTRVTGYIVTEDGKLYHSVNLTDLWSTSEAAEAAKAIKAAEAAEAAKADAQKGPEGIEHGPIWEPP